MSGESAISSCTHDVMDLMDQQLHEAAMKNMPDAHLFSPWEMIPTYHRVSQGDANSVCSEALLFAGNKIVKSKQFVFERGGREREKERQSGDKVS